MANGLYETSGNQPVPGAGTADLVALARGAGFRSAERIAEAGELAARLEALIRREGPTLIVLDIERAEPSTNWPPLSMKEQFQRTRKVLGESAAPALPT